MFVKIGLGACHWCQLAASHVHGPSNDSLPPPPMGIIATTVRSRLVNGGPTGGLMGGAPRARGRGGGRTTSGGPQDGRGGGRRAVRHRAPRAWGLRENGSNAWQRGGNTGSVIKTGKTGGGKFETHRGVGSININTHTWVYVWRKRANIKILTKYGNGGKCGL